MFVFSSMTEIIYKVFLHLPTHSSRNSKSPSKMTLWETGIFLYIYMSTSTYLWIYSEFPASSHPTNSLRFLFGIIRDIMLQFRSPRLFLVTLHRWLSFQFLLFRSASSSEIFQDVVPLAVFRRNTQIDRMLFDIAVILEGADCKHNEHVRRRMGSEER